MKKNINKFNFNFIKIIIFSLVILFFLISYFIVFKRSEPITITDENIKVIIDNHMTNLKNKNIKEGLKNVYFTEFDEKSGFKKLAEDTLSTQGQDYNSYEIIKSTKINNKIYLVNIIVNTNDLLDESKIVNKEFNPYICNIENELYIVFSKERIPKELYEDINKIPDNYNYQDHPNMIKEFSEQNENIKILE